MASTARIRYDIEANATGAAEVERLAQEFEQLDGAFPTSLAEQLREASRRLQELGQQQAVVETFVSLKRETEAARLNLQQAQDAAQSFARGLSQTEATTRTQAAQLERLRDAVKQAKTELETQTRALDGARAGLQQYGISSTDVATRSTELRREITRTRAELDQLSSTGRSAQGFSQLVRDTDAARDRMATAAAAAEAFGASLGRTGPPTAAQSARLQELQAAADRARSEFEALQSSTVAQAASMRQAGANTERLTAAAREQAAAQQSAASATRISAAAYSEQGAAAARAAQQQQQAAGNVQAGLQGIAAQLRNLQALAGAALGGQLLAGTLGDISRTADAYSNLAASIRIVTGEGAAFNEAFEGVFDIAQRTSSQVNNTAQLFTRIAQAGKQLNLTNQQALALTETINQSIQLSGGSAESADAAIQQLIQGLQSGVLRGEEFNSVMEQAPRLAQALAAGLGVTTGELRKQAEAGRLTSQVVIAALQGQADVVAREFDKLPPTVGRAITNLSTSWTRYVGEVDQANGISAAAARAINALAGNLDTLGTVLLAAGKAAAAYKAIQLAQTFLANAQAAASVTTARTAEAAATARATAATLADTVATNANTAAKGVAATAIAGVGNVAANAAGTVGRLAGLLATLRTFTLIGLVTNLETIGTALGEGIAKLMGYGKAIEDNERKVRADEAAARANARQTAALAQAKQLAAEKALQLSNNAKTLMGEFEGVRTAGGSVTEALEKVSKALNLSDLQGIKDASAALDALALRGKITADQVSAALASALNSADLQVFETTARAAFDGGEQGARRLAATLEAVTIEALRRAGTSAQELQTGFSAATNSAINDVDILARELQRLGTSAGESSRLLAGSLDRALEASNTERAVQAVITRMEDLGRQGLLTGEQLSAGLEQARGKLDALRPGISSIDEALRTFGLRSQAELQATADNFRQAWEQIRTSTQVSLSDKIRAFEQFSAAAAAANDGVIPSELRLQEELLKSQAAARGLGTAFDEVGNSGVRNLDRVIDRAGEAAAAMDSIAERNRRITEESAAADAARQALNRTASDNTGLTSLEQKIRDGTLSAADLQTAQSAYSAARTNAEVAQQNPGAFSLQGLRSVDEWVLRSQRVLEQVQALVQAQNRPQNPQNAGTPRGTMQREQTTSHTVTINLGGRSTTINAASAQDASALTSLLQQLEAAAARAA